MGWGDPGKAVVWSPHPQLLAWPESSTGLANASSPRGAPTAVCPRTAGGPRRVKAIHLAGHLATTTYFVLLFGPSSVPAGPASRWGVGILGPRPDAR